MEGSCRALVRLATERRYDLIPEHVKNHPEDVLWQDKYGTTALHKLCLAQSIPDSASLEALLGAVDAILAVAPHLVGQPNHASWTPLHMACDRRVLWQNTVSTEPLVMKLVDAYPEAVSIPLSKSCWAKTPFFIACENNASAEVLRKMLRLNPSLASQPAVKPEKYTQSTLPLHELWNATFRFGEIQFALTKMELVLRAAYAGNVDADDSEFHPLCAACSIRCPRDFISKLIAERPDLIRQRDNYGLLPLHYAVQSAATDAPFYTAYILEKLLDAYPEAASIPFNRNGLLPLHVLIADRACTHFEGGISALVKACPETLRVPDPRTGLVPMLSSAKAASESRQYLTATFELLRAAPDVIRDH